MDSLSGAPLVHNTVATAHLPPHVSACDAIGARQQELVLGALHIDASQSRIFRQQVLRVRYIARDSEV